MECASHGVPGSADIAAGLRLATCHSMSIRMAGCRRVPDEIEIRCRHGFGPACAATALSCQIPIRRTGRLRVPRTVVTMGPIQYTRRSRAEDKVCSGIGAGLPVPLQRSSAAVDLRAETQRGCPPTAMSASSRSPITTLAPVGAKTILERHKSVRAVPQRGAAAPRLRHAADRVVRGRFMTAFSLLVLNGLCSTAPARRESRQSGGTAAWRSAVWPARPCRKSSASAHQPSTLDRRFIHPYPRRPRDP